MHSIAKRTKAMKISVTKRKTEWSLNTENLLKHTPKGKGMQIIVNQDVRFGKKKKFFFLNLPAPRSGKALGKWDSFPRLEGTELGASSLRDQHI